jgi:NADPH-dependent 2,4-dienoyl-CoA reductase/sulfur reductase-like enzyme
VERADVAVVGGGPAGLAATVVLAEHGVDVVLVDEQARSGGQIYRQLPETFAGAALTPGAAYARGRELLAAADAAAARRLHRTVVWGIFEPDEAEAVRLNGSAPAPSWLLALDGDGGLDRLAVRHVLVATGAYDLPVAFPGWTLPGVMAAGGVQAFLKSQKLLPGRRFVLAGAHPLLLLVADQLLAAGADVAAVALAQPRPAIADALAAAVRLRGRVAGLRAAGGPLLRLRRAHVPVLYSHVVAAAEGSEAVEAVRLRPVDDAWRATGGADVRFECDVLAFGYGFVPSTELARQAGCAHAWHSAAGGWVTEHDAWQRASRTGISVAGEVTGVAGAEQAEDEGRLAAIGILRDLGALDGEQAARLATPVRRRLRPLRRFSALVQERFEPQRAALAALADGSTVVCRCEEVTADELRSALAAHPHLGDVDAVKQLTRVGMGPCQGRFCQLTVAALTAAATGRGLAELGPFTARPPVKPMPLGRLADAWNDEEEVRA